LPKVAWIAYWMTVHFMNPAAGYLDLLTMRNTCMALVNDGANDVMSLDLKKKVDDLAGVVDPGAVFQVLNLLSLEQLQISEF